LGGAPARRTGQTEYARRRRSSVHNVRTHEAKTREERLNRVNPAAQRHESRRPDIREPRRDGTGCALREAPRNPAQQTRVHSAAHFATDVTPPGCALRETREVQRCGNLGQRCKNRSQTEKNQRKPVAFDLNRRTGPRTSGARNRITEPRYGREKSRHRRRGGLSKTHPRTARLRANAIREKRQRWRAV
jgi:hypothetical protein